MERLTEENREYSEYDIDMNAENCAWFANKLAEYEDLEESGRLVKLPCAMGDTIWVIGVMDIDKAEPYKVTCITYRRDKQENNGVYVYASGRGQISFFVDEEWERTVFATREAAEAKLKEMEGKNE